MVPLMDENIIFVQVQQNEVTRFTKSGALANRKRTCQPTFLLLDRSGSLLHLQRGLVVSELKRVCREHLKFVAHTNITTSQSAPTETEQEEDLKEGGRMARRSSMKVDSMELQRRNSMASSQMKNAFKSTTSKRRSSLLVMQQQQQQASSTKNGESSTSFKSTMQDLNNINSAAASGSGSEPEKKL